MSNKKTQKDYFNELLKLGEVKGNPDLVKFIEGRLEALAKKAESASKAKSKTQSANADLKGNILAEMAEGKAYTITGMIKELPSLADLTNQKVSAVVNQMVAEGTVIKSVEKRVSYFTLA